MGVEDTVRLTLTGDIAAAAAAVAGVDGVTGTAAKDGELEILVADAHQRLPRLLDAVVGAGAIVRGVDLVSPDLEAVFLHLTGRALRDAD